MGEEAGFYGDIVEWSAHSLSSAMETEINTWMGDHLFNFGANTAVHSLIKSSR